MSNVSTKTPGTLTPQRIAKFWSHVEKTPTCWNWTAAQNNNGYGQVFINGQAWLAHRFSWFLAHGTRCEKFILHSCDNRLCVNPEHLREGDHHENIEDRIKRNRSAKGERHGRAVLREIDVIAIRTLYGQSFTVRQISDVFTVKPSTIKEIVYGRNWKHLAA